MTTQVAGPMCRRRSCCTSSRTTIPPGWEPWCRCIRWWKSTSKTNQCILGNWEKLTNSTQYVGVIRNHVNAFFYRYKRPEERKILDDAMGVILPVVYQRLVSLMPDESEYAVLLQKQILKVFYAFIQVIVLGSIICRCFSFSLTYIRKVY